MADLRLIFSHELTEGHKKNAYNNLKCDHIIPLLSPLQKIWSNILPDKGISDVIKEFKEYTKVSASKGNYILIQGDPGMVFSLVHWCLKRGMIPIYSTTKRITEETYKRDKKEILFGNIKIDLIRKESGNMVVAETKKSPKGVNAARMQLLFYFYKLKELGVDARGELLIPKERKKIDVELDKAAEETYKKEKKEVIFESNKIDVVKREKNFLTIIETKKASKMQLLNYLYVFSKKGYKVKGEIRIPKEKKIISVELGEKEKIMVEKIHQEITELISNEKIPKIARIRACRNCSRNEFCWS